MALYGHCYRVIICKYIHDANIYSKLYVVHYIEPKTSKSKSKKSPLVHQPFLKFKKKKSRFVYVLPLSLCVCGSMRKNSDNHVTSHVTIPKSYIKNIKLSFLSFMFSFTSPSSLFSRWF